MRSTLARLKLYGCVSLLLLLSDAHLPLCAQTFNLDKGREPVASLDGLWRFHTGDNPAWANPNFDDSQWPLLRSDESWAKQGYKGYSGYAWYRFQVVVPPGEGDISLLLPPIMTSYQIFVNGKLAKTVGRMPPHGAGVHTLPINIPLHVGTAQSSRSITIALRVWHWRTWASYYGGGPQTGGGLVGQSSLVQRQSKLSHDSALLENGGLYTIALADGIAGLLALLLFFIRRTEREYLWFACLELLDAFQSAYAIYSHLYPVSVDTRDLVNGLLSCAISLFMIAFLFTLLRARCTMLLHLAIAAMFLTFVNVILLKLIPSYPVGGSNLAAAGLLMVFFVWAADLLIRKARAGLPDARLLLAPVLLAWVLNPIQLAFGGSFQLGWQKSIQGYWHLFTRPFEFSVGGGVQVLFLLAMLAILINRFACKRREEQRIAGELDAARGMQALLVPANAPNTPGFTVESVYLPASEVGGDFFQVQPDEDGSLLVVVGDVSGKGLKAAMTVSTIVGALHGCTLRTPAEVLGYLNRILHRRVGGFVTCCATLITADGAMTIANAGHLSPYRNGEEMAVEGGLPLGILAEGSYEETRYELVPGDRLTFMSDGVVEARNTQGELYGFERTQKISNQPAATIADTAKSFGQEDDITVVTVTRTLEAIRAV